MPNKKMALLTLGAILALGNVAQAETTGQFVDDTTITTKVKAALVGDSKLAAGDISVTTDHGTVTLTGNVDSAGQYALAAKDVMTVSGVQSVKNDLTIHQSSSKL